MNKDEALRLALEALELEFGLHPVGKKMSEAITAIKEALAQPEQKPVAWISRKELLVMRGNAYAGAKDWRVSLGLEPEEGDVGLYTTPPQRTWVGLTDEEIKLQWSGFWEAECHPWAIDFAQAIEAKLRSKNESKN
jgi:hypothetical protein